MIDIVKTYVQTDKLDYSNLAPDFPTGGIIINKKDLSSIYAAGKGKAVVRAKVEVDKNTIKITELPYQVYVEPLIEEIKDLIQKEEISGIDNIYNKTDKKRLLVEIECSGNIATILNKLYSSTSLQKNFNANQFALVGKTPVLLNLKQYLDLYINHNITCIQREYEYDLKNAQVELEKVEGLLKALEHIDEIIKIIKKSESSAQAELNLINEYSFTSLQAKAIVNMKLGRLAHLEYVQLNEKKESLLSLIKSCKEVLESSTSQKSIFLDRLSTFGKKYSNPRKTQITQINISKEEKEIEFVEPEKCIVVMTEGGTIKRIPTKSFRTQRRNGKGIKSQEDITSMILRTNTIDSLMIFTNKGKMYRLLVNDIPVGTNASKGQPIKSLVTMENDEVAQVIYSIYRDTTAKYIFFVTKNGTVKKTSLEEYVKTKKKNGIDAINLREGDSLASVLLINEEPIILLTKEGQSITFNSTEVGASGRKTFGIKGISLGEDDYVICGLPVRDKDDSLAVFNINGTGKRMAPKEQVIQKRGGKGLKCSKAPLAGGCLVSDEDKILVVGNKSSICIEAKDLPLLTRSSTGNIVLKDNIIKSVSKI